MAELLMTSLLHHLCILCVESLPHPQPCALRTSRPQMEQHATSMGTDRGKRKGLTEEMHKMHEFQAKIAPGWTMHTCIVGHTSGFGSPNFNTD